MYKVVKGCINDFDYEKNKPVAYNTGDIFPRRIEVLIKNGVLEEILDMEKPKKKNKKDEEV